MLIRHAAAIRCVETTDEDGRLDLLASVVAPGDAVLEASLSVAKDKGVSTLALRLAKTHRAELRRPSRTAPGRRQWLTV